MAKLRMKKLELIAPLTDSKKIIELLQRRGVVELCRTSDDELVSTDTTSVISEFEKFRSIAAQALEILNRVSPEEKPLLDSLFPSKKEVGLDAFGKGSLQLEKIMHSAAEIVKLDRIVSESESAAAALAVKADMLQGWTPLDVPMNYRGTDSVACFIGSVQGAVSSAEFEEMIPECSAEVISSSKEMSRLFIMCLRENYDTAAEKLRDSGFVPISDPEADTPSNLIAKCRDDISMLSERAEKAREAIRGLAEKRRSLEFAVDYLQMRKDKYDALSAVSFTGSTFVLTGYIPEKYTQSVEKEITSRFTASIEFSDPDDDEDVPVLLENSSFSAPVEGITEMYALPSKNDVDPTPVMSFFYYLFFGMMLSDAGYGVLMVLGCSIALAKFSLDEKMRKTLVMFRNCGVSTVIFGALFGSWFGDIVQVVGREFFGREIGSIALWFEPLDDPIKLLLYSFALGIAHLFLGLGVSFAMKWKSGKKLDAILDTIPIYLTILGVCPAAAGILTDVPKSLQTIGLYVMAVGVALLVFTSGRSSKSIFGKLFGGLYTLYNTATGYLSDILSYSRLLALGLATGSIAGVINLIGTMPENTVIKAVLLVVVFIVGHTANLGINLLGAYVHTDRLQFVELFSKFYEGGGRQFDPFTVKTNYIKFKEESINE